MMQAPQSPYNVDMCKLIITYIAYYQYYYSIVFELNWLTTYGIKRRMDAIPHVLFPLNSLT